MKLTTKKIIAQEFLILILVLTLGLVSFLCTYPYNAFKSNQVEKTKTEILEKAKQADSLSISYKSKLDKQNWFFEKFSNHYDLTDDTTFDERDEIWKRFDNWAVKGSINYRWENKWGKENTTFLKSIGFPNSKALQSYIENNRISKIDSSNFASSISIIKEIKILADKNHNTESKILSYKEQTELGFKALIICFIILFGLRYLFFSIKWSLKTFKQKSE